MQEVFDAELAAQRSGEQPGAAAAPLPPQPPAPAASAPLPAAQSSGDGGSSAAAGAPGSDDDGGMCVVCMDEPATAGLLHGDTVHRCVCHECARRLMANRRACPLCNARIDMVVRVF